MAAARLVDVSAQTLQWAPVLQLVKAVARANELSDDVRNVIKSYLSAPEPLLVLAGLTVRLCYPQLSPHPPTSRPSPGLPTLSLPRSSLILAS